MMFLFIYKLADALVWLNCLELQQCSGAYRITPVDVNSRPSSCL